MNGLTDILDQGMRNVLALVRFASESGLGLTKFDC